MMHGGVDLPPCNGEFLEMDFDLGRILTQLLVDLVARVLARWIPISTMNPPLRVIAVAKYQRQRPANPWKRAIRHRTVAGMP